MSTRRVILAVLLGLLIPLAGAGSANAATGPIRIRTIHYAQSGTNLNTEYIVFKNITTRDVQIQGWEIISAPSSDNQHYFFPKTLVRAGSTLTLYTGYGTNSPGIRYWNSSTPRWDNAGDKAILKNAYGTTMDTCAYIGGGTTAYC